MEIPSRHGTVSDDVGHAQIGNRAMSSTLHFGPDNKHDVWRLTNYPAYLLQVLVFIVLTTIS